MIISQSFNILRNVVKNFYTLHFIWWHLTFVGQQYGTCWDLEFWSGFKISGNCVHPRLSNSLSTSIVEFSISALPYFLAAVGIISFHFTLQQFYMIYILITYQFQVKPLLYLYTILRHIHKTHWKIADSLYSCFDNDTSKLSFHCTCTQNMCGNHSDR